MIQYTQGNLLDAQTDALVNTVNTVGVMSKGIAQMFKKRFPLNMAAYVKACKANKVQTGKMFVTRTNQQAGPQWLINFPTEQHSHGASKMEWIINGLLELKLFIVKNKVQSVAIPPLGAGHGGLEWPVVQKQIELALSDLQDVDIVIYQPCQSPRAWAA